MADEQKEKSNNWFLRAMIGCCIIAVLVSFYFFYYKKDYDFIIGIQGHIEKMTKNYPLYQKLIEKFIQNASIERVAYE